MRLSLIKCFLKKIYLSRYILKDFSTFVYTIDLLDPFLRHLLNFFR